MVCHLALKHKADSLLAHLKDSSRLYNTSGHTPYTNKAMTQLKTLYVTVHDVTHTKEIIDMLLPSFSRKGLEKSYFITKVRNK